MNYIDGYGSDNSTEHRHINGHLRATLAVTTAIIGLLGYSFVSKTPVTTETNTHTYKYNFLNEPYLKDSVHVGDEVTVLPNTTCEFNGKYVSYDTNLATRSNGYSEFNWIVSTPIEKQNGQPDNGIDEYIQAYPSAGIISGIFNLDNNSGEDYIRKPMATVNERVVKCAGDIKRVVCKVKGIDNENHGIRVNCGKDASNLLVATLKRK